MTAQQTKDLEATILQEIDGDEAWNTVETLATTVRLSGNEDEAKAIAYLQSKLDSHGVKQTLYMPTLFVSWPLKATLRVLGDDGFSVMAKNPSMSVSTEGKEVEGDLFYLETGWAAGVMSLFNSADLGDADLTGKVVITEGLPMPGKVADISARGALAADFVGTGERLQTEYRGAPPADRQPQR